MENLFFEKVNELRKEKVDLETKLDVKIIINGKLVSVEGESFREYEALRVLKAMQFGFSAKKAIVLLDEDMIFREINIKQFTRRKDMHEVRARIIGREGKTKKTIEEISACSLLIREDNMVGIIGPAESIEEATMAITNLIKGSKQANVYHFLEKMNTVKKTQISDLGLKIKK